MDRSLKRTAELLATAVLVLLLTGAAAYFLASLDKHPIDHRYLVRASLQEVSHG